MGPTTLAAAEASLFADGVSVLSVRTLGPSDPDPYYAQTRAFYAARGCLPVEELPDLWPDNPSLLMVKPLAQLERPDR